MQSPASRHEWIMNANAIPKPRYSAAVDAIPQPCASLPSFFFPLLVMHLPRRPPARTRTPGRRAGCRKPIGASYARSIGDQTYPSLRAPSLLFWLPFFTLSRSRYSGYFSSSSSSSSFGSCSFAAFPNVHTRQKAFHRGTPNRSSY